MKKIIVNEEKFNRLLRESGYGNDDLTNLFENLKMEFSDFYSVLGEHYIMAKHMGEEPNPQVIEIKHHADAIKAILDGQESELDGVQPEGL